MLKKKVIIVDDEPHYRDGLFEFLSGDAEVITFEDPDGFAEFFQAPNDLERVSLIILDYRFDQYNASDKDLVTYIRDDLRYKGNIVLWSLEDKVPQDFSCRLNAILPKKLMTFWEIDNLISAQKNGK
jgi:hypothetical protein